MELSIKRRIKANAFRHNVESVAAGLRLKQGMSQNEAWRTARDIVKKTWKQESKKISGVLDAK